MRTINWYLNRFSKMSSAEILYRIHHRAKAKSDEFFLHKKYFSFPVDEKFELSGLRNFSEIMEQKNISEIWTKDQIETLLISADDYLNNLVNIFGQTYNLGRDINWHIEPKADRQWPKLFWNKVNIRDGFTFGAPKFVWEVNRLYCLPVLGLAFKATKKKEYADKIMRLIGSWVENNSYPYGVNWTSGIEMAVRTANVIWALFFLTGYEFKSVDRKNLNVFFYCHGRQLFRYPSKYSSNNNHAVAEAFGLFLIGVFFPFYKESEKWRQYGQKVLERECLRQILSDGGSFEYSTTYLSFVFDFFLLFKIVCDNQGIDYSPKVDKRLEKSCEYIYGLMDCKGNIPNIGDQDSAVLVNLGLDNHENFQSILNTGAVLFGKEKFKTVTFPDIKTWMLVGDKINISDGKFNVNKAESTLLTESGLGVIRGQTDKTEILFVGNATPLGMPPLYGHGHLDALSIYLSIGGRQILVDPGTYLYHSGGKWRRYFRSTAAHNTIRIDKQDLAEQVADFMFGKPYAITEHFMEQDGATVVWTAGHDAYQKEKAAVVHTRKVVFDSSEVTFKIKDTLDVRKECQIEQFFHFHPQCRIELQGNKAFVECDDIAIVLIFDAALQVVAFKGSEDPLLGWFSKAFNHIEPCWSVVGQAVGTGKQELITKIMLHN